MSSLYIRKGLFPFYEINQQRDFQLKGYYNNWKLALKNIPKEILAPFRTPLVDGVTTAPTTMTIRRVKVVDGDVEVISQESVTSNLQTETVSIDGTTYRYYYRLAVQLESVLVSGYIYDIYIKDSLNNEFVSDLFKAVDEAELYIATESGDQITTESGEPILI